MERVEDKPIRDSKMELLRIISMILIVMHHFACHGGYAADVPMFNKILLDFFVIGGKIGVNIFVMLSGYFLIKGKFRWQKVLRLVVVVFTYSVVIYSCFLISGKAKFGWEEFSHKIFPIIFNEYWFITAYVITYLLSPFLNKLANNLEEKDFRFLLLILIVFQSIITLVSHNYFSNVGWFLTIYLLGAFLRLHGQKMFSKTKINILVFVVGYLTIFAFEAFSSWSVYQMNSIFCLITTVALFNIFAFSKKQFSSKFINTISSTTLGIYLIHDNNSLRAFLWKDILHCPQMAYQNWFWLFAIISVVVVFVVCAIVELARHYAIEKPIEMLIKKHKTNVENQCNITQESDLYDKQ